ANKGRARHRFGGISASVFLSDSHGGKQIGSIIQTIAVKGEGAIFQIVRDQSMNSLGSQIREFIPLSTIVFTDEGYPFLKGIYRNHRMINHSAKSKDKRYKWARNRWSKNGVHSQVAEGNQSKLKNAFKSYNYFTPKFAPFYLSEYSLLSNVKAYGLEAIANVGRADSEKVGSGIYAVADGIEGAMEKREKGVVGKVCRK
ncbi:MAG TPA: transposase, partial [Leptospiraceae bacterium]|nr:transposase [Leptospiraceae bacterium]